MRLSLIAAAALLASKAWADDRAASWVSIHASTDNLIVVSPQASVRASIRAFDLQAGWDADIISGASVDVRTSASPHGYTEVRQGITLGAGWRPEPGTTIAVRYTPSWEPDYESETFSATASKELVDRRLAIVLGARGAFDRVGRVGSARDTWQTLDTGAFDLGLGWVFDARTVGNVGIETQLERGFQSSPYRFARVGGFGVPERVPEARSRLALALGLRRAVARRWFAATSLRLYDDTWSVASHTEDIDISYATARDRFVLGAFARFYGQSAASFYRGEYAFASGGLPSLRTADKLLAPSFSVLGGIRSSIAWTDVGVLDEIRATIKLELYEQRFFDFAPLTSRAAAIVSFGIAGTL